MRNVNWGEVTASGDFEKLPVGGYVCVIKSVEDVPNAEYLRIVWDVAEGEYKDHYKRDEDWSHTMVRSYKEKARGMFKAFLEVLENDDDNFFSIKEWNKENDEQGLRGLKFGALIQERYYTNDKGEDKTALEVARVIDTERIRRGDYKMPEPRDQRVKVESPTNDADVPF